MKNIKQSIRTAVILCGGKGSRLGELGKKIPKTLVKVQNKPILWYILNILKKNSFNHFILTLGYKGSMIKKYLKHNKNYNNFNIEPISTGSNTSIAQRIFKIKNRIRSNNFLLLNGDAIFDDNINKFYNDHEKNKYGITFLGCSTKLNLGIVGKIKNKIVSFERDIDFVSVKKKYSNSFAGYVYSGISIINTKILRLNFKNFTNFEKKFYPKIIKKYKSNFKSIDGFWYSIDNLKDINVAHNKILNKYSLIKKIKKKLNIYEKNFLEK
jgi:glucose-1-phosphate cytidylyltransferase